MPEHFSPFIVFTNRFIDLLNQKESFDNNSSKLSSSKMQIAKKLATDNKKQTVGFSKLVELCLIN